jgi:hypothetical protein
MDLADFVNRDAVGLEVDRLVAVCLLGMTDAGGEEEDRAEERASDELGGRHGR